MNKNFYVLKEKDLDEWSISSDPKYSMGDYYIIEYYCIKHEYYISILKHFGAFEKNDFYYFKNKEDAEKCAEWLENLIEIGFGLNAYTNRELLEYMLEQEN